MAKLTKRQKALVKSSPALTAVYRELFARESPKASRLTEANIDAIIASEAKLSGTGIRTDTRAPSGGGGLSFKTVGTNLLHALTVPGAVVTTLATKAEAARHGGKNDISWKNLAGTFRGDKFAGGAGLIRAGDGGLLAMLGGPNVSKSESMQKWGGLGLDVATDPTWLLSLIPGVGVGLAGGKIAATGKRLENAQQYFNAGNAAARARADVGSDFEKLIKGVTDTVAHSDDPAKAFASLSPELFRGDLNKLLARLTRIDAEGMARGRLPALRLGTKTQNITIPLTKGPILSKTLEQTLERTKNRAFSLAPSNKLAQQLRRVIRGTESMDADAMRAYLAGKNFSPGQRTRLTMAASIASADTRLWERTKKEWAEAGKWDDDMNDALEVIQERGRLQGASQGMVPYAEQAKAAKEYLEPRLGELADLEGRTVAKVENITAMRLKVAGENTREALSSTLRHVERAIDDDIAERTTITTKLENELAKLDRRVETLQAVLKTHDPALQPRKPRARKGEPVGRGSDKDAARSMQRRINKELQPLLVAQRRLRRQATKARTELDEAVAGRDVALANARMEAVSTSHKAWGQTTARIQGESDKVMSGLSAQLQRLRDVLEHRDWAEFTRSHGLSEFMKNPKGHGFTAEGTFIPSSKRSKSGVVSLGEALQKAEALSTRGPYVPSRVSRLTMDEARRATAAKIDRGAKRERIIGAKDTDLTDSDKLRAFETIMHGITRDNFIEDATKLGVPADEAAAMADEWERLLNFAPKATMWSEIDDVIMRPELDLFAAGQGRQREAANDLIERQLHDLANETVRGLYPGKSEKALHRAIEEMVADLQMVQRPGHSDASLAKFLGRVRKEGHVHEGALKLQIITAWIKKYVTTMNPGFYPRNAIGQFFSNLIIGGPMQSFRALKGAVPSPMQVGKGPDFRHLSSFGLKADPNTGELIRGADIEYLNQTFKVGKREMTGWEIAVGARLSGLGMGFTQADVEVFLNIAKGGRNPATRISNAMQRFNMRREDAMRMASWIGYIRKGDDMLTAGAKVIRTYFDYDALTDFERVWARNLMLFYTWFKNNMVLQGYGMATRPGIYSTLAHFENSRPKVENEPEWWKKAGGVGSPMGLITFGNPMAEVNKWSFDKDNLRQILVGGGHPLYRAPLEYLMDRNTFTGAEGEAFEGQNKPHWTAALVDALGIPTPQSRRRAADEAPSPAWPAGITNLLTAFQGPQGSTLGLAEDETYEGDKLVPILSRIVGLNLQPTQPEKFAASAKARETRRKGDATRKRNYEKR